MKRDPANRSRHVSVARSAVGRLVSKTHGFAPAASSGTRSTREEYARPACISGLKRSASLAVDGRYIPTGMCTEQMSMTGRIPTLSFALSHLSQSGSRSVSPRTFWRSAFREHSPHALSLCWRHTKNSGGFSKTRERCFDCDPLTHVMLTHLNRVFGIV